MYNFLRIHRNNQEMLINIRSIHHVTKTVEDKALIVVDSVKNSRSEEIVSEETYHDIIKKLTALGSSIM